MHEIAASRPPAYTLVLVLCIPLSLLGQWLLPDRHLLNFILCLFALLPASQLLGKATDQIAARVGEVMGSFLLSAFANVPEMIIALAAIHGGEPEVASSSIIGSIIGKTVLVLGIAFLVAGVRRPDHDFNPRGAMTMLATLSIATVAFIYPTAMHRAGADMFPPATIQSVSLWIVVVLLAIFFCSLQYSLRTHRNLFAGDDSTPAAPEWSTGRSLAVLAIAIFLTGLLAELMVGEITPVTERLSLSKTFIGLVVIAGLGNLAEMSSAADAARRGRTNMAIGIALGSAILVALFVIPILVISSYFLGGQPLDLVFKAAESVSLFLVLFVTSLLLADGKATWFKGVQLIGLYVIIAASFYYLP